MIITKVRNWLMWKAGILSIAVLICTPFNILSAEKNIGIEQPLKYISGCEMDFDKDNKTDLAMLIETSRGYELLVHMRRGKSYESIVLRQVQSGSFGMSCDYGFKITETTAADLTGKTYSTNGKYISFYLTESSSWAYYWENGSFQEVSTSD